MKKIHPLCHQSCFFIRPVNIYMLWIRKYLLVNSDGWPNERNSLVGAVQLGTKGELGSLQPDCLPLLKVMIIDIPGVPYNRYTGCSIY